jgi:hypothetical protein
MVVIHQLNFTIYYRPYTEFFLSGGSLMYTLTKLDLGNNQIRGKGAEYLADVLKYNNVS